MCEVHLNPLSEDGGLYIYSMAFVIWQQRVVATTYQQGAAITNHLSHRCQNSSVFKVKSFVLSLYCFLFLIFQIRIKRLCTRYNQASEARLSNQIIYILAFFHFSDRLLMDNKQNKLDSFLLAVERCVINWSLFVNAANSENVHYVFVLFCFLQ